MDDLIEKAASSLKTWEGRLKEAAADRDGDKEWLGMCDMMVVSYRMVLSDLRAQRQVASTLEVLANIKT